MEAVSVERLPSSEEFEVPAGGGEEEGTDERLEMRSAEGEEAAGALVSEVVEMLPKSPIMASTFERCVDDAGWLVDWVELVPPRISMSRSALFCEPFTLFDCAGESEPPTRSSSMSSSVS